MIGAVRTGTPANGGNPVENSPSSGGTTSWPSASSSCSFSRWSPDSVGCASIRTTRTIVGYVSGKLEAWMESNSPRMLSLPSRDTFAASQRTARLTCTVRPYSGPGWYNVHVRHVTESDVRAAVDGAAAVARVREALVGGAAEAASAAVTEGVQVRTQPARLGELGGVLAQGSSRAADGAVLTVVGAEGRIAAVIEADWLTRLAAAAAATVAAAHLAPPGRQRVGIVGDGALADAVEQCLGEALDVQALRRGDLRDASGVVRDATLIVTATRARDPV